MRRSFGKDDSLNQIMKPMEPMLVMKLMSPMEPMRAPERWWPEELGENPNSAGGQNETRYAFFGDQQRLAVDADDGKVQGYNTGDHRISGVQQHQSGGGRKVTFTSQHGEVDLGTLKPASRIAEPSRAGYSICKGRFLLGGAKAASIAARSSAESLMLAAAAFSRT